MKYNELQVTRNKNAKRVGRGISAGGGKTAGRGTKGQNSRTGGGVRPGFEGGQNPLMQRLPKLPGFRSPRAKMDNIYSGDLNQFSGTVTNETLAEAGLVATPHTRVKVVVGGAELSKKVTVKLQSASAGAKAIIEKAGGSFEAVPQVGRKPKQKTDKK